MMDEAVLAPSARSMRAPVAQVAQAAPCAPLWAVRATVTVTLLSIAIAVAAAHTRGPWIDEFWTLFAADPALPLATEIPDRWLTDVHPPLFFLVSRGFAQIFGGDIAIQRLQNLLALAGLLAFFVHADQTWSSSRRFLLLYAVLAFTSYFSTAYFAEYRSYYMQFAAGICLFGSAYAVLASDLLVDARQRRVAMAVVVAAAALMVNLHFISALLTELALAGMAGAALVLGQRRVAMRFCAAGVLSALPLAVTLWFQLPHLGGADGQFWINSGTLDSLVVVLGSVAKGIGLSLAGCALAAWALITARGRRRADIVIAIAWLGIAAAGTGLLLVVNLYRPVIVDRYLVVCSAAICCSLAILGQDLAFTTRAGFAAILLNAVIFLGISANKLIGEPRWNETAEIIGARVAACPGTVVTATGFPYTGALVNEGAVFALGYAYLAERHGFQVGKADRVPVGGASGCPALLWVEHVPWRFAQTRSPEAFLLDTAGPIVGRFILEGADVTRTKTGAVITRRRGAAS